MKNPERHFVKLFRKVLSILAVGLIAAAVLLPMAQVAFADSKAPAAAVCDEGRRTSIKGTVTAEHARLENATFWWSAAVGVTQYGSIVLSLLAGVLVKTTWMKDRTKNAAAGVTALSALLITASTAGGFHEKWQANRTATYRAKALILELDKSSVDCDAVLAGLQDVMRTANDSIVTAGTGIRPIATQ